MRTAFLLLLVVVAIVLAVMNPTLNDFESFVRTHSEELVEQHTGESALGRALSGAASTIASTYVSQIAEREDYIFFSTYTVDLDRDAGQEQEWRFLGIAGMFFELERPAALQRE